MRVLLQRVSSGSVTVDGQVVSSIKQGFVALVGVTHDDDATRALWLADKIAGLRVFEDEDGKMNLSVEDVGGALLVVSQFTLYADASRGRRPSFVDAAQPEHAEKLINYLVSLLREKNIPVSTGVFGADMKVELVNDGPVTIMLER